MTFTIESGIGTPGANAYVDSAFVTAYLTDRGRETQNDWLASGSDAQKDAIVEATDFIETKFRDLFKGCRFHKDISCARATVWFSGSPGSTESVTIGTQAYTFVTTLTAAYDVLIGDSTSETIENMISAVNAGEGEGTDYGTGTVAHETVAAEQGIDNTIYLTARSAGTAGNDIALSRTAFGTVEIPSTLAGGSNVSYPQPLSFPRAELYDDDNVLVSGIPALLKNAAAEYAVRAIATPAGVDLAPDPTHDDFGGIVTSVREKVGPIETEIAYLAGTATGTKLRSYPTADRMLSDYIKQTSGGTYR